VPEIVEVDGLRTIAVLNQKGGVGKTTTTVNTAAALAAMGLKVVVIDLDPQAHLTIHYGVEPQTIPVGSYDVLTQSAEFEQSLMLIRPNLWLLGANIDLVGAETELVSVVGREIILREAMLTCQEQFDFCLIDCAPSLGLLSLNALAASQEVLIPLQPHFLALQGFGKLLQTIDLVNKRINRDLKVTGVLLCMFDTRASLPNEVRADIARFLTNARGSDSAWAEAQLVPTFIRRNIKLAEAPSYGQTIFEYDPTCNGAADYRNVGRFFLGIAPKIEGQAESESEVEPEPETAAESEPVAETGPQEVHHEHEPTSGPDPAAEHPIEFEPAGQEPHHDLEPAAGTDPVIENEVVLEAPSPEIHHESESMSASDPAAEDEAAPAPWDLHHEPELVLGSSSATEHETTSGQTAAEFRRESEPEPVDEHEHDPGTPQEPPEHPPIQIREFHLPAPQTYSPRPFQDGPAAPVSPPEPSQAHDEAPDEAHPSQDEPEQVGL
jgi:chromosome partitioning protein